MTGLQTQQFLGGRVTLHCGDCLDVLDAMDENSVDSVVCDPPYHLTSIVKRFGADGSPLPTTASQKRYGDKSFSDVPQGNNPEVQQFNRLSKGFMGKQWDGGDVAFQVETWRKVLRVLKPGGYILAFASSRGFGRMSVAIEDAGFINHPMFGWIFGSGFPKATRIKAEGYEGFRYGGQATKPALEPVYMGQKPFSEATGTANILRWGTGALNIDGCRVDGPKPDTVRGAGGQNGRYAPIAAQGRILDDGKGRWPANVIHDGSAEVLEAFPEAPGQQFASRDDQRSQGSVYGTIAMNGKGYEPRGDEGSAARFFYTAKADAEDRLGSKHPTVKPLDLMQYLVRLVTPPGGLVLDPFAGTGTTGEAAWREGMRAVLIEREPEYQADIARRMELAEQPTKRAAVAKSKNNLQGAEGTPLFGDSEAD